MKKKGDLVNSATSFPNQHLTLIANLIYVSRTVIGSEDFSAVLDGEIVNALFTPRGEDRRTD